MRESVFDQRWKKTGPKFSVCISFHSRQIFTGDSKALSTSFFASSKFLPTIDNSASLFLLYYFLHIYSKKFVIRFTLKHILSFQYKLLPPNLSYIYNTNYNSNSRQNIPWLSFSAPSNMSPLPSPRWSSKICWLLFPYACLLSLRKAQHKFDHVIYFEIGVLGKYTSEK